MRRDGRTTRTLCTLAATTVLTVLAGACGDSDGHAASGTIAPATSVAAAGTSTTTTLPSESALANADGSITTGLGMFPLLVSQCSLDESPLVVVAETEDGAGHLELHGTVDSASVEFTLDKGDGSPVVWLVPHAALVAGDGTVGYEGRSMVDGHAVADTDVTLTISC